MSKSQTISAAVKAEMDHRGISRRRLAREVGVDRETIGRLLDRPEVVRRTTVVAVCLHLGLPVPPVDQEARS